MVHGLLLPHFYFGQRWETNERGRDQRHIEDAIGVLQVGNGFDALCACGRSCLDEAFSLSKNKAKVRKKNGIKDDYGIFFRIHVFLGAHGRIVMDPMALMAWGGGSSRLRGLALRTRLRLGSSRRRNQVCNRRGAPPYSCLYFFSGWAFFPATESFLAFSSKNF